MLYLDYSANTPVDEEVLQCFCEAERRYPGNANAHHQAGATAKAAINEATRSIARRLGAPPAGIIYTSGASEANNLAVKGLAALGGAAGLGQAGKLLEGAGQGAVGTAQHDPAV